MVLKDRGHGKKTVLANEEKIPHAMAEKACIEMKFCDV